MDDALSSPVAEPELLVRTATVDDVASIVALWSLVGVGGGAEIDDSEIRHRLATKDEFFIVGVMGGELIASVMGCYDGHRGHIKRVAVAPEHGGRGVGQQMMREVEDRFRAAGVTGLRLAVWNSNTRGLAFWQASGWTDLTDIHYFTKEL